MDATSGRQRLNFSSPLAAILGDGGAPRFVVPVAPAVAISLAALGGLMFLLMPIAVLEDLVVDSGIASFVTAAQPPLGITAHFVIAFLVALVAGGVSWFGLYLVIGARVVTIGGDPREDGVPVLRRADAHPDAPARRPVFANRDLGTPFLEVTADTPPPMSAADAMAYVPAVIAERPIPVDLDTPLATYRGPLDPPLPEPDPLLLGRIDEPVAAPAPILAQAPVPEPEVAVDPRPVRVDPESPTMVPPAEDSAPRFASHERIETFELTPMVRSSEPSTPLPSATIHDLLDRLERGVA
ncbi:MAG TPA: hypothetical protein VF485_19475, partial [Sphingomonas sp.]